MLLWVGARRCLSIWTKAPCGIGFAICALIVLVATSFVSVSTNRESLGSVCRKQDKNAHDRQLYHYGTTANTGDIRELRETVIRHPVLVSRAPWPSAAAYLTDIGVDPATVCSAPRFGHAPEHALPDTSAREDHIQIVGSCGLCGHSDSMVASFGRGLSVDVFCSGRQDFQSEISSCCFVKVRSASFVAELLGINTLPDSAALSQYNGISFS
eukprot:m.428469 g.428469  ORF g.428469 m.428469 type:complete len:212 (-) comp21378_c1_seq13:67-702(-)